MTLAADTLTDWSRRYSFDELAAHLDPIDVTADEAAAAALSRLRDSTDRSAGAAAT